MAENTAFRNNALPYPVYGVPWVVVVPILDADGDPVTGASSLDSEISLNGDTIADAGTEAEIGGGLYSIALTGANMTADVVSGVLKTGTAGAKTTCFTLNPRKLVSLRSGTAQGGAAGYITLDASAGASDDRWNGCLVVATIDGNVEARIITDYTGSNQQAAVTPNWNVTPDSDDTFVIYLPEGMQRPTANVTHVAETAQTAGDIIGDTNDIQARLPAALTADGNIKADTLRIAGTVEVAGSIAAIKAKTDNLPASPAAVGSAMTLTAAYDAAKTAAAPTDIVTGGAITTSGGVAESNVKKVNDVTVTGTGAAGDEWGP
jgi:hypothetical protein